MKQFRAKRWLIFCVALYLGITRSTEAVGQEVHFFLAPEADWANGEPPESALLETGSVYLYRSGDYRPSRILKAGSHRPIEPIEPIEPGTWHWIAEAPGYVSTEVGALSIRAGAEPFVKNIVWPVVPACTLRLGPAKDWQGVTRIDFVSLDRNAVYPLVPQDRTELQIPAGAYLLYTVTARGPGSISPVQRCEPREIRAVPRPEPPPPGRQHLMASATVPATYSTTPLVGTLRNPSSTSILEPTAVLRTGRRGTFFFLHVDAARGYQFALQHPDLLTAVAPVHPLDGSVRELPDRRLRPRLTLEIPIDYQPARAHQREELSLSFCGRGASRHLLELDLTTCKTVAPPKHLEPGLHSYRFDALDTGNYLVDAWIDDQRLVALGNQVMPLLTEDSPDPFLLETQTLKEFHIYGHLLKNGDSVAGEVRLEPRRHWDAPLRRFPTDEDQLYHIYYFAEHPDPFVRSRLPGSLARLPEEQLLGSFHGYTLIACDDKAFCRPFHRKSTLSGGGQLDIDLGSQQQILFSVIEAETGDPVPQALVTLGQGQKKADTLHFANGESVWNAEATLERLEIATDAQGVARLRGVPAGPQRLVVIREGYRWYSGRLTVPTAGELTVTIPLERPKEIDDPESGILLHHPGGDPVLGGALIALDLADKPLLLCSRGTGRQGRVPLPPACLNRPDLRFLLLAPSSRPTLFSAGELRHAARFEIAKTGGFPRTLQLIDGAGEPVADVPIQLRLGSLGGLVLTPDILLAGTALSGVSLPFTTDRSGRLTVPFLPGTTPEEPLVIDPTAGTVVTLPVD